MLSILMPAFNAEKYLPDTLKSLLEENKDDFEIVICDDGSTDGTAKIAQIFASRDPRVRYIRQPNKGASAARNAAFLASHGRWIIYIDADDIMLPGSIRAMMTTARSQPNEIVFCRWCKISSDADIRTPASTLLMRDMAGWEWLEQAFSFDYPTYPGCFLLPRELIERAGGWNEQLSFQDDMEFYARLISQTNSMRYCSGALFCYRQGVIGSLSNTGGRRSSESQWEATRLAVRYLLNTKDTPQTRSAAVRQLMLVSYAQYIAAPDISKNAEDFARKLAAGPLWEPPLPGGPMRLALQIVFGWKFALKIHGALKGLIH